jgi:heat shock protein HslJ
MSTTVSRYARGALNATVALGALLVSFGCSTSAHRMESSAVTRAPTLDAIRNATIPGIYPEPVTLKDGVYEGAPFVPGGASRPQVTLWDHPVPSGPMRGVSGDVTAVFLSETSGGSGEQIYLTAFCMHGDKLEHLGTILVGDRTKVRSAAITDGRIALDLMERGAKEPSCCGTQLARKEYAIENHTLAPLSSRVTGTLSLATVSKVTWKLVSIDGRPVASAAPTIVFDPTRVSGFSGCNRYTGRVVERAPGQIEIQRVAATMMACTESENDLEARFLEALTDANAYTFLAARLALSTSGRRGSGLLLFEPEP